MLNSLLRGEDDPDDVVRASSIAAARVNDSSSSDVSTCGFGCVGGDSFLLFLVETAFFNIADYALLQSWCHGQVRSSPWRGVLVAETTQ